MKELYSETQTAAVNGYPKLTELMGFLKLWNILFVPEHIKYEAAGECYIENQPREDYSLLTAAVTSMLLVQL